MGRVEEAVHALCSRLCLSTWLTSNISLLTIIKTMSANEMLDDVRWQF